MMTIHDQPQPPEEHDQKKTDPETQRAIDELIALILAEARRS